MHLSNIWNMIMVLFIIIVFVIHFCKLVCCNDIKKTTSQDYIWEMLYWWTFLEDLGVLSFSKTFGRCRSVAGCRSDILAEVMSALCMMGCEDMWTRGLSLFQATHASVTQKIYHGSKK